MGDEPDKTTIEAETDTQSNLAAPPYPSERYAWYVVSILLIVYIFSFIDRQILALLVGPIKNDLGISDSQMSYLMGFSFAVFYTFFGIPLGRLADSKSRRTIIALGLAVWSIMSAGCGIAKTYTHLLLFRMGVGVGEASLSPSAYSLITDYFKPQRLALAISVYGAGIYLGSGMAFLFGGLVVSFATGREAVEVAVLGTVRPWQFVFFAIGLPGIIFAFMLYTVREPIRRGIGRHGAAGVPLGIVLDYLKKNWKTFLCHTVGFAMLSFVAYGASSWIPAMYVRVHGWDPGDTGIRYGWAVMIFGTAGIVFGGQLAARLAARGHSDSKMRAGFIAAIFHIPLGIAFPIIPDGWLSFAVLCPAIFTLAMPFGVAPAAIQEMMPNQMRGQASALYLFVVNLIGLGIGPSAVAWCTDYVFQDVNRVHHSLLLVGTVANTIAAVLLFLGLAQFRKSLGFRDAWQADHAA
jgi:MFS family permease